MFGKGPPNKVLCNSSAVSSIITSSFISVTGTGTILKHKMLPCMEDEHAAYSQLRHCALQYEFVVNIVYIINTVMTAPFDNIVFICPRLLIPSV